MPVREIERQLDALKVGGTRAINDHVVTRWAEERYEVNTWGRRVCVSRDAVCELIAD